MSSELVVVEGTGRTMTEARKMASVAKHKQQDKDNERIKEMEKIPRSAGSIASGHPWRKFDRSAELRKRAIEAGY